MKSFKKFLNEEWSPEKQQEWLNSIHDMPLEEAQSHGELDLVSGSPLFVDDDQNPGYTKINDNHGFTKFLTHPEHSNESALEHINFLLKVAHTRDHGGGVEKLRHYGNEKQSAVFHFAKEHYPTLAYAMAEIAKKRFDENKPNHRTSPSDWHYGENRTPSPDPIQITPEHLDQINREHGVIRTSASGFTDFTNSNKKHLMSGLLSSQYIDIF